MLKQPVTRFVNEIFLLPKYAHFLQIRKMFICFFLIFIIASCSQAPSNEVLSATFLANKKQFSEIVRFLKIQKSPSIRVKNCLEIACYSIFPSEIKRFLVEKEISGLEYGIQNGNFSIELTAYRSRVFTTGRHKGFFYTNVPSLAGGNYTRLPLEDGWFLFDISL